MGGNRSGISLVTPSYIKLTAVTRQGGDCGQNRGRQNHDMIIIDILRMELDERLPYWLSPEGKGLKSKALPAGRQAEIRAKHRAKWLSKQKFERDAKRALAAAVK